MCLRLSAITRRQYAKAVTVEVLSPNSFFSTQRQADFMPQSKNDPSQHSCFRITKFERWELGELISMGIPSGGPLAYLINMTVFAVVFGIPVGFALHGIFGGMITEISYFEAMSMSIVPFAVLGIIQIAAVDDSLKIEIDWSNNQLRKSTSFGSRVYPLNTLRTLTIRGLYQIRMTHSSSSSRKTDSERVYRAQLEARFDGENFRILHTDSEQDNVDLAIAQLSPFAEELAAALNVDLHREEPIRQKHGKLITSIFRAPLWLSALFILLVAGSGGYLCWKAQPYIAKRALIAQIEELGGSVSDSDLTVVDEPMGTVSGFYFTGKSIKDEQLLELKDFLVNWGRFKLDLNESRISDEGLQAIAGNQNLLWIDLRDTRITDEGVKTLSNCKSLVEVNLNGTRISDNAIDHLLGLPNLLCLRLFGTRITDQSIPTLAKFKGLREIYLIDTRVTPEGLGQLREQLPSTTIYPK
jgi:hypothetical protein